MLRQPGQAHAVRFAPPAWRCRAACAPRWWPAPSPTSRAWLDAPGARVVAWRCALLLHGCTAWRCWRCAFRADAAARRPASSGGRPSLLRLPADGCRSAARHGPGQRCWWPTMCRGSTSPRACGARRRASSPRPSAALAAAGLAGGAAGTLFIERERKRDALRVVHQMAEALRAGDTVAVFPEGTTGDGPRCCRSTPTCCRPPSPPARRCSRWCCATATPCTASARRSRVIGRPRLHRPIRAHAAAAGTAPRAAPRCRPRFGSGRPAGRAAAGSVPVAVAAGKR
jgi:hypothetical protein